MGLSKEMQDKIYDDLNTQYEQVGFFQDQVVIVDNEKRSWDTAIEALDGNLLGQIQVVNRAIDDVKDAYNDYFTGVTSCRSDLFWVAKNVDTDSGGANNVDIDLLSNGFKIRSSNTGAGELSFGTRSYVYVAIGQSLVGSNNVPATAR